jgi:2-polyprenyl-6-methoxyphenol hydroxylase-like FAD-dependent oxidoreductase
MARIVMVGGGVVGQCAAAMLGRDGHDVTVLERDPAPPPDPEAAWNSWERRGVNQFRLLHFFQPRFRELMDANLPEVMREFRDAGAVTVNAFRDAPAEVTGGFRETDVRFDAVTARRPVAEAAVARVVAGIDSVNVRRGVAVAGLISETNGSGVPHVVGVRTEDGEELRCDLVIDAAGRRSVLPSWLTAIGARAPVEEKEDCGFVYYGRHFRSADGSIPPAFGPLLMPYGTISLLTLPADNGTWGVGIITSADDAPMRGVKNVDAWTSVVKAFPLVAHWLDGEPLDEKVAVMAKIEDRHRDFIVDGVPVATGVLALADSWACTNPSVGRGVSIGAIHAVALRDLLHDAPKDPMELARRWHDATMETVEPWYRGTLAFDSGRLDEIHAQLEGRPFEPSFEYGATQALNAAVPKDPDMFRRALAVAAVLDLPEEIFAEPEVYERAMELGGNWREETLPGPDRAEVLSIVSA